jgi:hypothetical protein
VIVRTSLPLERSVSAPLGSTVGSPSSAIAKNAKLAAA